MTNYHYSLNFSFLDSTYSVYFESFKQCVRQLSDLSILAPKSKTIGSGSAKRTMSDYEFYIAEHEYNPDYDPSECHSPFALLPDENGYINSHRFMRFELVLFDDMLPSFFNEDLLLEEGLVRLEKTTGGEKQVFTVIQTPDYCEGGDVSQWAFEGTEVESQVITRDEWEKYYLNR